MAKQKVFIDFKELKQRITIKQVLDHYGLTAMLTRKGDELVGSCPACKSLAKNVFKANLERNMWNCFAGQGCKGGNILDLVMAIEGIDKVRDAGVLIVEWFGLFKSQSPVTQAATSVQEEDEPAGEEELTQNRPLEFTLKNLERDHTAIHKLGLKPETINRFSLGWCSRSSIFKGRVVFPIHNILGELVAYAGLPNKTDNKHRLPPADKFNPKLELYNAQDVFQAKQKKTHDLVIVQDFAEVWKLSEIGLNNVVSLMPGMPLTMQQLDLLLEHLVDWQQITLICDPADHITATLVALTSNFYVRYGQFSYQSLYQDILKGA